MFAMSAGAGVWSQRALRFLKLSIVMSVLLSVLDGVLRVRTDLMRVEFFQMATYWAVDFRIVFEQGILASVVLFVGARIFETRTIMSIGYDTADASKIAVKGPDDDHIVWVGRRYGSAHEAEAVAAAFSERLEAGQKAG